MESETIIATSAKCGDRQEITAMGVGDFEELACRRCGEPLGRWGELRRRKPR